MLINDLKLLCTIHIYQHHSEFGMVVPVLFRETLRAGEVLQPAWNHIAQINYESGNVPSRILWPQCVLAAHFMDGLQ